MDELLFDFVENIMKGKRRLAQIWKHKETGRMFYLAFLGQRDIFRCAEPTISEAQRKGVACWHFPDETIIRMRVRKIDVIAVKVRETGDLHFVPFADAMKRPEFRLRGLTDEQYATRRYIPLSRFWVIPGKIKKLS